MKSLTELDKKISEANKEVIALINDVTDARSFVEADKYIGSGTDLGYAVGEGVVSGYATINDNQIGIFAINGNTLKGGIGKSNAAKIAKCVNNSVKMSVPVVGIIDTEGARFAEGIEALEGYGEIINAFGAAYGVVPTFLVVRGNNFGMLSYLPAFCDFTVCYEKSVMATTSPLILAAKSVADVNSVGTAELMAKNGVSSFTVSDGEQLKTLLTDLIDVMTLPVIDGDDDGNRVCDSIADEADVRNVIGSVFDKGSFVEVKKDYAQEVVTGFARLNGIAVGVVANDGSKEDGRITYSAAEKITDFVNTLESFGLPLVNLVNSKGVVNCLQCQSKLMKSVGEMIYALNVSSLEKISVIVGNAMGAAYVAFANKNVYDYVIAWENAKIGMLDGKQSAELVYGSEIAKAADKNAARETFTKAYEEENSSALVVAEKGYIDNVIDPAFTRQYLIAALQAFIDKR